MQLKYFAKVKTPILILFVIFFLMINNSSAQNSPAGDPLNEIGSWGFGSHEQAAIDEARNLAYVNSGSVVLIIDISDVSSPVLVNDLIRTSGIVKDLSYNSATQNLYVTLGENGLEIWDVQNINSPQHLSSLLLDYFGTTPPANKMVIKPNYIFIAAEYAGIITINVSDPSNPYQTAFNLGSGGTKYSVSITEDGNFLVATSLVLTELFTVNSDGSLSILDISSAVVGGWEVHVSGNYSYEINQGVLYVLDLTTLGLQIVGSYNLPGNATTFYSITHFNNRLYVSDPFYGIEIFDISNPGTPLLLGSYETSCKDVKYFNGYVFVPDITGMIIIDVSDPTNPAFISEYEGVGLSSRDVKVSGSYCYLSTAFSLYAIDVSNATLPVLVGVNQPMSGIDLHLEISGNYAYLTNTAEGLRAVDISDPANPVTVGNSSPAYFNNMAMDGNYIYVADNQYNLRVFDISNPSSPNEVGSLNFPDPRDLTSGIAASNGYVYVSQYNAGLKIIDVSDPAQPVQVGTYNQNVELTHLDYQDGFVYAPDLSLTQSRIYIFDVSDPTSPFITGTKVFSNPPPHAYQNFVFGDVLLVSDHTNPYLTVLDVSNPAQPSQISTQMVPDQVWGVDATENYFYVATYGAGLHIYENPYGMIPVELTSFTVSVSGNNVQLKWQTAAETNNSGFEVQKKVPEDRNQNSEWDRIGFIEGQGTTTEINNYSLTDKNISAGNYKYRLKQIDFDGSFEYSEIIEVTVSDPTKFSLEQNYPNPFNPATKIKYSIPQSSKVVIKVFDILGNEIETLVNKENPAGTYELTWSGANLPSGVYIYQLKATPGGGQAVDPSIGSGKVFIQNKKMILLK